MKSHNHFYNFLNDIDCEEDIHHIHNGENIGAKEIDAALLKRKETNIKIKKKLSLKLKKDLNCGKIFCFHSLNY